MRDEAPLYYNEKHDFYALSRFEDVKSCSTDWKTYISGKGSVLELIKSGMEIPPGIILFEDPAGARPAPEPPEPGVHARGGWPRSSRRRGPSVPGRSTRWWTRGKFDFIHDLAADMPMRVIGMLLGHPRGGPGGDP